MGKRLFQLLDDLHVKDIENETKLVGVCPTFVSADYGCNSGTKVTMGVPGNVTFDIQSGKVFPVLFLVDKSEFDKLNSESDGKE